MQTNAMSKIVKIGVETVFDVSKTNDADAAFLSFSFDSLASLFKWHMIFCLFLNGLQPHHLKSTQHGRHELN